MDAAKPGFVATLIYRAAPRTRREGTDPREAFWGPILERLRPEDDESPNSADGLEAEVLSGFPDALYGLLAGHFRTPGRYLRGERLTAALPRELFAVFFGVTIDGYSSALLAVDVAGVRELAELLQGNLDTFTLLMEAFVPSAFAEAVSYSLDKREFAATIAPTVELARVFAQVRAAQAVSSVPVADPVNAPVAESRVSWLAKVPRALLATAFSLLTPVLLSLIVLYCAAQMLLQDRLELSKREAVIAADERDLRKTESAAVKELRNENLELQRLLRAPPSPAKSP